MKRFLDLADFTREEIVDLLALAQRLQDHPEPRALAGRVLGLLFLNPSLRTLSSMQAGMARLGGSSFVITPGSGTWQLETRTGVTMDGDAAEHIREGIPVLASYCDALAGNHAQGVALSAQKLGLKALIVMPLTTPQIKVQSVAAYGAAIELHGNTYNDAAEHAKRLAAEKGLTFIHPYDDPDVIAGQGTIAMELLRQHAGMDAVFVPVGGGGLIAGVAAYLKSLRPDIKVIGVEPDDAACMYEALVTGERVILDQVGIFADGVAVRQVGEETFRIAREGGGGCAPCPLSAGASPA